MLLEFFFDWQSITWRITVVVAVPDFERL